MPHKIGLREYSALAFETAAYFVALLPFTRLGHALVAPLPQLAGAAMLRAPMALCLGLAFGLTPREGRPPWRALLAIPISTPQLLGLAMAAVAWAMHGFAS